MYLGLWTKLAINPVNLIKGSNYGVIALLVQLLAIQDTKESIE